LADRVQRIETHQHAKCRQNLSIGCEDINIFDFFLKMVAVRHLGFGWAYLDHPQKVFESLYHFGKFRYDRYSSFDNMKVSIFGAFGWKTPIHPPPKKKSWFWGNLIF